MTAPYIVREEPQHREPMPAYIPDWSPEPGPAPCRCVSTALAVAWLGLDAVLFLVLCVGFAL